MPKKIKCASFFAGIGGFDLGFENARIKTVFQCEIDIFCQSVLQRHWPKVPKCGDIRDIDPASIPDADIWCGGFPCQDVSVARGWLGREGFKGQNTGLFYPFANLIDKRRPQVVLLENVSGLLSSHDGKDFSILLHTLSDLGYGVAWRTLNTRYFGAPQSRPRVYICAWSGSAERAYNVLFEHGACMKPEKPRLAFLRPSKCKKTGAIVPEVAFCLAATSGRHTGTDWSRSYVSYKSEVRRLTPTESERIQGFPAGWTEPYSDSSIGRDDLDSLRYKAAGNAVSVPVVEWVGRRIVKELRKPAPKLDARSVEKIERYIQCTPSLGGSKSRRLRLPEITGHDDAPKIKWANAGVVEDLEVLMGSVAPLPQKPVESLLIDALDKKRPDGRYFLSPNAAKGILRRVNSQGRKLFEPLEEALGQLQSKG